MGAFFLFKDSSEIDHQAVKQVFLKKGFNTPPLLQHLGDWELWLYRKQLIDTLNYIEEDNGYAVYATGTVVYKSLDYTDSLKQLLDDFKTKDIAKERLLGNFCLLFWDGQSITFLTDALNVHHVFVDEKRSRISTSFLSLLASHTQKLKINKLAFYENLTTGYIVGSDTLVNGIQQIDETLKEQLTSECHDLIWERGREDVTTDCTFHDQGFKDSIRRQIAVFKSYFGQVNNLHTKYHGELGLSSGYDSRLLLAGGDCFLSSPLAIHTHSTIGVHDFERSVAEEIAHLKKLQIRAIDVKNIEKQDSDKVHKLLLEGLYFFDARCSYDMGAYSETYTGSYKKRILCDNRLSFNGLGGEIFRNYSFTSRRHFNTLEWVKSFVFYYYAEDAINDSDLFQQAKSNILSKLSKRLNSDIRQSMSILDMRRYYSEIRMPDCDGINHNAQNQLVFYLTPFIEPMVIDEALKATSYIGTHGKYQAELIRCMDPSLASVQSHYGFPFDRIPVSHSISSWAKGHIPDRAKNLLRRRYLKARGGGHQLHQSYIMLKKRCNYLKDIEDAFTGLLPRFDWNAAMCNNAQKATTIFLASFVHEFSNKCTW